MNSISSIPIRDNLSPEQERALIKRFWSKVDKTDGCWEWKGSVKPNGYGAFGIAKMQIRAHRMAWELTYGKIPSGLFICHRCNNTRCVNPAHLYAGTPQDNINDMVAAGHHLNRSKGEDVKSSRLTAMQVAEIRKKYSYWGKAGQSLASLAKEYGVSRETIRLITTNQMWKE